MNAEVTIAPGEHTSVFCTFALMLTTPELKCEASADESQPVSRCLNCCERGIVPSIKGVPLRNSEVMLLLMNHRRKQ